MAEPKKKDFEDPVNAKIQRKFDLIFGQQVSPSAEVKPAVFNHEHDYFDNDSNLDRDMSMSDETQKKATSVSRISSPSLDFDIDQEVSGDKIEFSGQHEINENIEEPVASKDHLKLAIDPNDTESAEGIEFDLDFGAGEVDSAEGNNESSKSNSHFELDLGEEAQEGDFQMERTGVKETENLAPAFEEEMEPISDIDVMFDEAIADAQNHMAPEGTQKTIVYDKKLMGAMEFDSLDAEMVADSNSTADFMSTEEVKANIDATIKDILRPKNNDNTQEIDISTMVNDDGDDEDEFKEFRSEESVSANQHSLINSGPVTNLFDLNSIEFSGKGPTSEDLFSAEESFVENIEENIEEQILPPPVIIPVAAKGGYSSNVSDEELSRLQGTIRQLREEREDFLMQIKKLKGEGRELEQDNLTLQAALDESKIEVSILRKRHSVELEDIKYRLSVNEEKKAMAIEQARLSETKREKLEQRVRIDFNQVKQREKELETKLEMLSIDIDSQVQSRDQKILELRRKIDALEFNMENVSIKEQKSHDDKRKLEDKLNKIMKTLRHSIKNLEDDIDQANDEVQDIKNTDGLRSKA